MKVSLPQIWLFACLVISMISQVQLQAIPYLPENIRISTLSIAANRLELIFFISSNTTVLISDLNIMVINSRTGAQDIDRLPTRSFRPDPSGNETITYFLIEDILFPNDGQIVLFERGNSSFFIDFLWWGEFFPVNGVQSDAEDQGLWEGGALPGNLGRYEMYRWLETETTAPYSNSVADFEIANITNPRWETRSRSNRLDCFDLGPTVTNQFYSSCQVRDQTICEDPRTAQDLEINEFLSDGNDLLFPTNFTIFIFESFANAIVSTNGVIHFGPVDSVIEDSSQNCDLRDAALPAFAPYWLDLNTLADTASIRIAQNSERLWVRYQNVRNNQGSTYTFSAFIFSTGDFLVCLDDADGGDGVIGVVSNQTSPGAVVEGCNSSPFNDFTPFYFRRLETREPSGPPGAQRDNALLPSVIFLGVTVCLAVFTCAYVISVFAIRRKQRNSNTVRSVNLYALSPQLFDPETEQNPYIPANHNPYATKNNRIELNDLQVAMDHPMMSPHLDTMPHPDN